MNSEKLLEIEKIIEKEYPYVFLSRARGYAIGNVGTDRRLVEFSENSGIYQAKNKKEYEEMKAHKGFQDGEYYDVRDGNIIMLNDILEEENLYHDRVVKQYAGYMNFLIDQNKKLKSACHYLISQNGKSEVENLRPTTKIVKKRKGRPPGIKK